MSDFQDAPGRSSVPRIRGVDGNEIPLYSLLHIDPESVRNDFEHAATWQATVAYAAAVSRVKLERLKRKIKVVESRRFIALRDFMEVKLGKPPSNDLVDHNVRVDPDMEALYEEYFSALEESEALESARFALYARRDILVSMGAETRLDRKLNDR